MAGHQPYQRLSRKQAHRPLPPPDAVAVASLPLVTPSRVITSPSLPVALWQGKVVRTRNYHTGETAVVVVPGLPTGSRVIHEVPFHPGWLGGRARWHGPLHTGLVANPVIPRSRLAVRVRRELAPYPGRVSRSWQYHTGLTAIPPDPSIYPGLLDRRQRRGRPRQVARDQEVPRGDVFRSWQSHSGSRTILVEPYLRRRVDESTEARRRPDEGHSGRRRVDEGTPLRRRPDERQQ